MTLLKIQASCFTDWIDWPMYPLSIIVRPQPFSGNIMNSTENFDVDEYRAELECQDDETLFGENELASLA